jgi:L-alanine-DL-glutamate epimerase-like enolase superfamily enzyme
MPTQPIGSSATLPAQEPRAAPIARVTATPLNVPIEISVVGITHATSLSGCLCEVETKDGLVGYGFTAITEEEVIATVINEVAGPAITGDDALLHERIWDRLYWLLAPRGQTGYAAHAIAAIDLALWDIKGKVLGEPVWRLLGGARERVPTYTTFGFAFLDRDALAAAAKYWFAQGHRRLKMTVGAEALQKRDTPRPQADVIAEDARRVFAVREAVGDEAEIFIDANCSLDPYHALRLAHMVEDARIGFFEEPITQNDVRLMAEMRRQTAVPLAAGQNEGLSYRFRDLLLHSAVDVLQPNVAIGGGFTQCLKVAGLAAAFNVPIANGGAWPFHNMHLHAGVAHGGLVEYHLPAVIMCTQIFDGLPTSQDGWLTLPTAPGLGFSPNRDRVRELAKRPSARGRGKG